ncbi:MAG TPA: hypothetical protein VF695_14045, partial [Sphingomonas sp.]
MTMLLAALLLVQASPAPPPSPTPDEIVVRGQRAKRIARFRMTTKTDRKTGVTRCIVKRRSGDPQLDAQICGAVLACVPAVKSMPEMQAC